MASLSIGAVLAKGPPELVAVHGYDTKFAMHALRLGIQGVELLTTERITLPEPERTYLAQSARER